MSVDRPRHQWGLRLAGDCVLDIEFFLFKSGELGSTYFPDDLRERAKDYGFPVEVVILMIDAYRDGYNAGIRRHLAGDAARTEEGETTP